MKVSRDPHPFWKVPTKSVKSSKTKRERYNQWKMGSHFTAFIVSSCQCNSVCDDHVRTWHQLIYYCYFFYFFWPVSLLRTVDKRDYCEYKFWHTLHRSAPREVSLRPLYPLLLLLWRAHPAFSKQMPNVDSPYSSPSSLSDTCSHRKMCKPLNLI